VLGDQEKIQTGLCVVAKRADTRSTWPLINHPGGTYYAYNGPLTLWRVIRASTAAPTFFRPQVLPTGDRDEEGNLIKGAFFDGAVGMCNNPALQCFLLATLKGFPFHWKTGPEDLMLVSVGTGVAEEKKTAREVCEYGLTSLITEITEMLIADSNWQNQTLLQGLSQSPTRWTVDGEIGDLYDDLLGGKPLLHYLRYDVRLEEKWLQELGLPDMAKKAKSLRDLSLAKNRFDLAKIGETAAAQQIPEDDDLFEQHFPSRFDTVIA
ncbi:MAG: hypothetical protein AAGJ31_06885, partial [Verrucomicrobiota bacterium]